MAAGIDGRKYSGAKCYVSARTLEEEAEEEGGRRNEGGYAAGMFVTSTASRYRRGRNRFAFQGGGEVSLGAYF